jgi:molecular chaperone IbpA|tara:strand:+ start:105 stop:575 length:471 start_codon:yes stop_codon:yes gene_type:complete
MKTIPGMDWANIYSPFNVGLDDIFNRLESMSAHNVTYPPYNLIKSDDHHFEIEIALAGFGKDEIEVTTETNVLRVSSKSKEKDKREVHYLHNGLSKRAFQNSWQLGDDVKVCDVTFRDGLLTVKLEKIVPEHQRRISYDINNTISSNEDSKVLLTE